MRIKILISFVIAVAIVVFTLQAQTSEKKAEVITPSAIGVSDTLQNIALQNSISAQTATADGVEIPNQNYIPRGTELPTAPSTLSVATVSAPPSSMFNQTSNGVLPVTVSRNYTGLGR